MAVLQTKRWNFGYLRAECTEGWQIIGHELRHMLSEEASKLLSRKPGRNRRDEAAECEAARGGARRQLASSTSLTTDDPEQGEGEKEKEEEDEDEDEAEEEEEEEEVPLAYGISVFSKLMSAVYSYQQAFVLDARIGLMPSRAFVAFNYLILIVAIILAFVVTSSVLEPTLANVLPGLVRSVKRLLSFSVMAGQIGAALYSIVSAANIIFRRRAIHQFILYRCSIIKLPRAYLRRTAVKIFLAFFVLANCGDALLVLLSLFFDPKQPQALGQLGPRWFSLLRPPSLVLIVLGTSLANLSGMCVPLFSCYLIVCAAQHLDRLLHKQMTHFKRRAQPPSLSRGHAHLRCDENPHLVSLLDEKTRRMIEEYSCDTLTLDWPQFKTNADPDYPDDQEGPDNDEHIQIEIVRSNAKQKIWQPLVDECKQLLAHLAVRRHSSSPPSNLGPINREDCCANNCTDYETNAAGLLFMYKNLIKSLSELKGMIAAYESNFGYFHIVMICIRSLSLAQWVTTALTEARLFNELRNQAAATVAINGTTSSNSTTLMNQQATFFGGTMTSFGFRVFLGALVFVISNTYVFMRSDCLASSIVKMRSRLFRLNIDLATTALKSQELRTKKKLPLPEASQVDLPPASMQASTNFGQELDQIWTLYNQMVRVSEMANFKLSPGSHYSKRCLLTIFGRTVSLTLLCIQVIDIYSYT